MADEIEEIGSEDSTATSENSEWTEMATNEIEEIESTEQQEMTEEEMKMKEEEDMKKKEEAKGKKIEIPKDDSKPAVRETAKIEIVKNPRKVERLELGGPSSRPPRFSFVPPRKALKIGGLPRKNLRVSFGPSKKGLQIGGRRVPDLSVIPEGQEQERSTSLPPQRPRSRPGTPPLAPNATRILIPLKGAPRNRKQQIISRTSYEICHWVLDKIIRIPSSAGQFELVLVNINPKEGGPIPARKVFSNVDQFKSADLIATPNGLTLLEHMIKWMHHRGVPRVAWVRTGLRHELIVAEAKEQRADLVIVEGPHPNKIKRMLERNISKYCMKRIKCPVVVFPYVTERQGDKKEKKAKKDREDNNNPENR